jgi:hypothetical protein
MAETARALDDDATVIWEPSPKQAAFISCPADDVGFGGARGGGKSEAIAGDFINHEFEYGQHAIGMVFRRTRVELSELIERCKLRLGPLGFVWREQGHFFRGPKGGRLRFVYLESDSDADAYQGHEYTRVYAEEMGTFPNETPINKLTATLRSSHGVPCQFKGTCNPGGPGHQWVKARYKLAGRIDQIIRQDFEFVNPFNGERLPKTRVFIPSKLQDNKHLGSEYVANLFQVGSKELVDAWLHGDWDVIEGAFFDCWDSRKHVIRPFEIPADWLRFRAIDWGSAAPASAGWWAVVGDDYQLPEGPTLPRGALVRYREWYVASGPNTGLKLPADDVARGILDREPLGETKLIKYSVMDPAAFAVDGGPSIAERMAVVGVHCHRADNKRVSQKGALGGWDQMRARLIGTDGVPMIYCFSTCTDSIRTVPALQHDPDRPEDVDTDGEDHAADEWRYACMSRPWVPRKVEEQKPKFEWSVDHTGIIKGPSISDLIKRQARRREA